MAVVARTIAMREPPAASPAGNPRGRGEKSSFQKSRFGNGLEETPNAASVLLAICQVSGYSGGGVSGTLRAGAIRLGQAMAPVSFSSYQAGAERSGRRVHFPAQFDPEERRFGIGRLRTRTSTWADHLFRGQRRPTARPSSSAPAATSEWWSTSPMYRWHVIAVVRAVRMHVPIGWSRFSRGKHHAPRKEGSRN
jgi:hypothetical protein